MHVRQLEELCDAYEIYCGGVRDSIRVLVELKRTSAAFAQFLNSSQSTALTMSAFIKKPIEVLEIAILEILSVLKSVLVCS